MSRSDRAVHSSGGTIDVTWNSIFTGSFVWTRPIRFVRRMTCVSTANPGMPNPAPRITLAVLRPIPGICVSSSIVRGTSPPKRSTSARLAAMIRWVLARKNPVGLISRSTSAGSAAARSMGVGYRRNSSGVTRLTARSVVWAERMVAISNSNAFLCTSSVTAGYSSRNRSTVTFARTRAPRGGGGVIQDFLGLGGAKQSACHGSDLRSVRPSRQARRGRLHDEAESLGPFRLHFSDDRAHRGFDLLLAHRGGQVAPQHRHFGFLPARRVVAAGLAIEVDGLLAALHLLPGDPQHQLVVDSAPRRSLFARADELALQERASVQANLVALHSLVDHVGLAAVA